MAQRQQTKGKGWQSAGSMEETASLGMIKQTEEGEERGPRGGWERHNGPETVTPVVTDPPRVTHTSLV